MWVPINAKPTKENVYMSVSLCVGMRPMIQMPTETRREYVYPGIGTMGDDRVPDVDGEKQTWIL